MGAGQSTQQDFAAAPPSHALHVLRVTPDSPASKTGIEPLFDFVVGFQGDSQTSRSQNIDASSLERIVESHEGRPLNLLVWNSKSRETRIVPVVPSRSWSEGDGTTQPSLLGLSMRMCEPELAMDNVWHVLDVQVLHDVQLVAESAGLVPYGDYITGWSGGVLSSENDFYELVEAVCISSHGTDCTIDTGRSTWKNPCVSTYTRIYGLLHRIPPQPIDRIGGILTPPELQEAEDDYEEQDLFVPADVALYEAPFQAPAPLLAPEHLSSRSTPVASVREESSGDEDDDDVATTIGSTPPLPHRAVSLGAFRASPTPVFPSHLSRTANAASDEEPSTPDTDNSSLTSVD
ncbi:unnamed protein product [Mycena citricolor]|uniref:PDZ GRASP-type domain-containing protein n=1 Tax=Mycena citricolor TaxID=2018698 RepID=A0AAD2HY60_9AGAR|nr:unnamed protein product [Mycena citricolor]